MAQKKKKKKRKKSKKAEGKFKTKFTDLFLFEKFFSHFKQRMKIQVVNFYLALKVSAGTKGSLMAIQLDINVDQTRQSNGHSL